MNTSNVRLGYGGVKQLFVSFSVYLVYMLFTSYEKDVHICSTSLLLLQKVIHRASF